MLDHNTAAFPGQPYGSDGMPSADHMEGMTLRDWFAGQVLPAVVAATSAGQHHLSGGGTIHDMIAQDAYALADAMLAERAK